MRTHPDTWFWKGGPHGNILSGTNVGIPISGKQCFQFLKLLRGKMSALPPLTFIIHVVFVVVIVVVFTIIWICWRFDLIFGLIELTVGVIRTLTGFKGSWIWNRKTIYRLDEFVKLQWKTYSLFGRKLSDEWREMMNENWKIKAVLPIFIKHMCFCEWASHVSQACKNVH